MGPKEPIPIASSGVFPVMAQEEGVNPGEGLGWGGRRNTQPVSNAVRPGADRTVDLAATRLYRAEEHLSEDLPAAHWEPSVWPGSS